MVRLSKTTAIELAGSEIRVNAICPGVIFTPLMHSGNEEQAEEVISEIQPLPKRGEGSDIAGMALFLASDVSLFGPGQEHIVDGGLLASGPRMLGRMHNSRNLHRMAGMAYGSSGQTATYRRL